MNVTPKEFARSDPYDRDAAIEVRPGEVAEARHERWAHCHVNWTAAWVGALAAFSLVLLFGLVGIALGAHRLDPQSRVVNLKNVAIGILIFSVCSAFFSAAVVGGVAGKIAGILHSEPAMIHGAIVWLLTVPLLVVGASLGTAEAYGGWYSGLGSNSTTSANTPFARPDPLYANATPTEIANFQAQQEEYNRNVKQWQDDTPKATRNSAMGVVTALLIGLLGSVIGGWLASGEPMNFTHYRTRKPLYHTA